MWLKTTRVIRSGDRLRPLSRCAAIAIGALLLLASTGPARAGQLSVGNILTFSTGSTAGNSAGTWTLDDKSFTYLGQSGFTMSGTGGPEFITIDDSEVGNYHSFSLAGLGALAPSATYTLGYRVDVLPSSPYFLKNVSVDTIHLVDTVQVYKDVFSTFSLFSAAAGTFGTGDLAAISSLNGVPSGSVSLNLPKQAWVRDTIVLNASGQVAAVSNTFTQAVPEIDPTSFASVLSLVVGSLALAERRKGRAAMSAARAATC